MRLLEGINQAVMVIIGFAMRLAPLGVAGLIFSVTARFGFDVLKSLGLYVVTVLVALAIHQFGVIGVIAKAFVGIGPRSFFSRARALMVTAFSTSSSTPRSRPPFARRRTISGCRRRSPDSSSRSARR